MATEVSVHGVTKTNNQFYQNIHGRTSKTLDRNLETFSYKYSIGSLQYNTFNLTAEHCISFKLQPGVFKNIFPTRNFPELCKMNKHTQGTRTANVDMNTFILTGKKALFNKSFCSRLKTRYHIPSAVLNSSFLL